MLTNKQLDNRAAKLAAFEEQIKALEANAEAIKDEIKAELEERNAEEVQTANHLIKWATIISNKFDSKAFKADYPMVYEEYKRAMVNRRFTIA